VLHLFENFATAAYPFGRHEISIDFMSPDYFGSDGHFALFARGSMEMNSINPNYPYRGHGTTIGNVSEYPSHTIAPYGSHHSSVDLHRMLDQSLSKWLV